MLLRFEKNVAWKTPILFNSYFYPQVVTHWKLRTLLKDILWTFRYLLISCYFIFSSTKLFVYLNYVQFADKQLTRADKQIFYLLKTKLVQVKRHKEQLTYLGHIASKMKKLAAKVAHTMRKNLLNKTAFLAAKLLVANTFFLNTSIFKHMLPMILLKVRVGRTGKKYLRKGPHNLHRFKNFDWGHIVGAATVNSGVVCSSFASHCKVVSTKERRFRTRGPLYRKRYIKPTSSTISNKRSEDLKKTLSILNEKFKRPINLSFLKTVNTSVSKNKLKQSFSKFSFIKKKEPYTTLLTTVLYTLTSTVSDEAPKYNIDLLRKFKRKNLTKKYLKKVQWEPEEEHPYLKRFSMIKVAHKLSEKGDHSEANWNLIPGRHVDFLQGTRYYFNLYQKLHQKTYSWKKKTSRSLLYRAKTRNVKKILNAKSIARNYSTNPPVDPNAWFNSFPLPPKTSRPSDRRGKEIKTRAKDPAGFEYLYDINKENVLNFAITLKDFSFKNKNSKSVNKKLKATKATIMRIKSAFLNRMVATALRQLCILPTAIVSQNIMHSRISQLLALYNKQILHSLPLQYASYFYYKDLTNILVCSLTLRSSALLSFYLARLYEHVPNHTLLFHVFNRVFAVFKFYCKAPLSLRVLVKGRVNRKLRKHTMCLIQTQLSTSAMRSAIDYSLTHSFTGASVLGIKVWVISFSKSVSVKTFAQKYCVY